MGTLLSVGQTVLTYIVGEEETNYNIHDREYYEDEYYDSTAAATNPTHLYHQQPYMIPGNHTRKAGGYQSSQLLAQKEARLDRPAVNNHPSVQFYATPAVVGASNITYAASSPYGVGGQPLPTPPPPVVGQQFRRTAGHVEDLSNQLPPPLPPPPPPPPRDPGQQQWSPLPPPPPLPPAVNLGATSRPLDTPQKPVSIPEATTFRRDANPPLVLPPPPPPPVGIVQPAVQIPFDGLTVGQLPPPLMHPILRQHEAKLQNQLELPLLTPTPPRILPPPPLPCADGSKVNISGQEQANSVEECAPNLPLVASSSTPSAGVPDNQTQTAFPSIKLAELSLQSQLGGGAFGQVWRGTWCGTPVAVKLLSSVCQQQLPDKLLSAFEDEVRMLAGMRHPNICLFMGACMDPPNRAIVTELVSRGSLWDVLRTPGLFVGYEMSPTSRGLPLQIANRVLSDTCRGLAYLHHRSPPVIHRDLKSANLLVDESFHVKICDFGLARLRDFSATMTAHVGTMHWMAPEVIRGDAYTESADIYSLGIVGWEVLTGECPFDGLSMIEIAHAVANNGKRPELPSFSSGPQQIFLKSCWHQQPSQRWSAEAALAAVGAAFPSNSS